MMADPLVQAQLAELREQLAEQHKATLRFLGYMRDRLPETTAWDRFAAAALQGFIARSVYDQGPLLAHVLKAADYADMMMAERTRREAAALEAKKTKTDKQ